MNKVILIGRLARNPELKHTQSGSPITNIAIAVDRKYSNKTSGNSDSITVDFFNCVAFGKNAENIEKFFSKGRRIAIVGRLQTSEYTDNSGDKKYSTNIVIDEFEFVDNKLTTEG